MDTTDLRCSNVVALFRVEGGEEGRRVLHERCQGRPAGLGVRRIRNFFVLRPQGRRGPSFTVFPRGGRVVATGIPSAEGVDGAVRLFSAALGGLPCSGARVVNATYCGRVPPTIASRAGGEGVLSALEAAAGAAPSPATPEGEIPQLSFRAQCFPGARARWPHARGTANVFNNGKFVLVGVRSREEACRLSALLLRAVTSGSSTTSSAGTWCA